MRSISIISCPTYGRLLLGCVVMWVACLGCADDASIRTYRVAKQDSRGSTTPVARTSAATAKDQQMLGAIVPKDDLVWFFKLMGDPEQVSQHHDSFVSLVKSVEFSGSGQPTWKLPEGWQQQLTPEGITYSTLTHLESGLKTTVTRLAFIDEATEESWHGYVVENVNRWRKQLSLPGQSWNEISSDLQELPELSQGSSKSYFVSLLGKGTGSSGMGPFMGTRTPPPASSNSPAAPANPGSAPAADTQSPPTAPAAEIPPAVEKPIRYRVPSGWKETPASGMRMAAFTLAEEASDGEVTVIAAGGEIGANIGIWIGQVGAEATDEYKQSILQSAEKLSVQGVEAKLYSIAGAAAEAGGKEPATILVADVPWRSGQSLFVKFKGGTALATAQRQSFIDFVTSIQW
jgi:hypothetical protein